MKETVYKNIKYIAVVDGKVQLYKEKDKDKIQTNYYRIVNDAELNRDC